MNMCLVCGHKLTEDDLARGVCPECGMPIGESPDDDWDLGFQRTLASLPRRGLDLPGGDG